MYFGFLVETHSNPCKEQESAEQVDDPVERLQEDNPQRDHYATQHKGTQDTPKKHPVLIGCRYTEGGEKQHKDEDVINTKRFFDQVAREKLQRRFGSSEVVNTRVEDHRQCNPHEAPGQCLLDRNGMGFAMKDAYVKYKHRQNEDVKSYP